MKRVFAITVPLLLVYGCMFAALYKSDHSLPIGIFSILWMMLLASIVAKAALHYTDLLLARFWLTHMVPADWEMLPDGEEHEGSTE